VIVDYHMHLRDPEERIDHSLAAVERFVEVATERGIDEIGFTEHIYYFEQTRGLWDQQYMVERCAHDLDRYVGAVTAAKERGLPVKLGLEVDYVAGRERMIDPLFRIAQVHVVVDNHSSEATSSRSAASVTLTSLESPSTVVTRPPLASTSEAQSVAPASSPATASRRTGARNACGV